MSQLITKPSLHIALLQTSLVPRPPNLVTFWVCGWTISYVQNQYSSTTFWASLSRSSKYTGKKHGNGARPLTLPSHCGIVNLYWRLEAPTECVLSLCCWQYASRYQHHEGARQWWTSTIPGPQAVTSAYIRQLVLDHRCICSPLFFKLCICYPFWASSPTVSSLCPRVLCVHQYCFSIGFSSCRAWRFDLVSYIPKKKVFSRLKVN